MPGELFDAFLANLCKARVGQKYRPSNGTEGDLFIELWCEQCAHNLSDGCSIITDSLCYDVTHPNYPNALQYAPNGQPCCKAYTSLETS